MATRFHYASSNRRENEMVINTCLLRSNSLQVLICIIGLCAAAQLLFFIVKPQVWLNATGHKWNAATNSTNIVYHYALSKAPELKKVTASVKKADSNLLAFNFLQYVRSPTFLLMWLNCPTRLHLQYCIQQSHSHTAQVTSLHAR